jgi:hypothetical protein
LYCFLINHVLYEKELPCAKLSSIPGRCMEQQK